MVVGICIKYLSLFNLHQFRINVHVSWLWHVCVCACAHCTPRRGIFFQFNSIYGQLLLLLKRCIFSNGIILSLTISYQMAAPCTSTQGDIVAEQTQSKLFIRQKINTLGVSSFHSWLILTRNLILRRFYSSSSSFFEFFHHSLAS